MCVSLQLLLVIAVSIPAPAYAERAIAVEVTFAAPFEASELREALRVRLPVEGGPVRVRVALTPTGIQVETPRGVREVDVAGLEGVAAARMVALAASDLLLDDLATFPVSPPALVEAMPAAATTPPIALGVVGGVAGWDRALGGALIDVTLPRGARGLIAIEAGGGTLLGSGVHLTSALARLSGGVRLGIVELRAGAVLAPVFVSDGVGDTTLLAGATASTRVRIPISPQLRAVFAIGLDAFATRTEYQLAGMSVLTTPRLAPWLGIGMELTP
jgi:hypothetical protein